LSYEDDTYYVQMLQDDLHEAESALKFANDTNAMLLAQLDRLEARLVHAEGANAVYAKEVARLRRERDDARLDLCIEINRAW